MMGNSVNSRRMYSGTCRLVMVLYSCSVRLSCMSDAVLSTDRALQHLCVNDSTYEARELT
jgi:hypothetical protein